MNTIHHHDSLRPLHLRSTVWRNAVISAAVALTVLAVSLPTANVDELAQTLSLAATGAAVLVFTALLVATEAEAWVSVSAAEAASLYTAATVGPFLCYGSLYAAGTGALVLATTVALLYSVALFVTAWAVRVLTAQDAQDGAHGDSR